MKTKKRHRRNATECRNMMAVLRFYRDCGLSYAQMVKHVGRSMGGITLSTVGYYLNDKRCKADAR